MSIIIKKMETDEEIKGKAYVHWKAWQEAYTGLIGQRFLDGRTLEDSERSSFQNRDNVLVAKDGERVIGFVAYGKYQKEDLENTGEIYALYVLAEYYGQGIGYRLMQAALAQLKDYPEIALWVLKENARAIRFYERCGFAMDGVERIAELGKPVVGVRMVLRKERREGQTKYGH